MSEIADGELLEDGGPNALGPCPGSADDQTMLDQQQLDEEVTANNSDSQLRARNVAGFGPYRICIRFPREGSREGYKFCLI